MFFLLDYHPGDEAQSPGARYFSRLDAPAVPAVTQVVYKDQSWVRLTRDEGNPENQIYQSQERAQCVGAQISKKSCAKWAV